MASLDLSLNLSLSELGGVTEAFSYNGFGEPISYTASFGGAALLGFRYEYDSLGRIVTRTETVSGAASVYVYGYDLAGRLATVRKNGALISTYSYDVNGNRLSYTGSGAPVAGTYDAQDRLLQYGGATYTYSANGELQTRTAGNQTTTYTYDELGNLVQAVLPDGTQIDYVIDGLNRRIGKQVNGALTQGFLYDGQLRIVAELDGAGNVVSRFVYATHVNVPDYMIRGGVTYRILTDHLGSPRLVVDAVTGAVAQAMAFDEFGRVLNDTNPGFQPFGFAGGLYDRHAGLVRFGARDYDAEVGRWTAKDPIGLGAGTNLFVYVRNDPISAKDPFGLFDVFGWISYTREVLPHGVPVNVATEWIGVAGINTDTGPFRASILAVGLEAGNDKAYGAIFGGKEWIHSSGHERHEEDIILVEGGYGPVCSGAYETTDPKRGQKSEKGLFFGLKAGRFAGGIGFSVPDWVGDVGACVILGPVLCYARYGP
jgi:RHS repeat-associated protein